ncbi:hypothetical protein MBLNU457_g2942t1 [Dothideomycetes sp. NU457]
MTVKISNKKAHKTSTAVSRHRRRRNKIHYASFLLQDPIWHRIKYLQQYARLVKHIEQKLYVEQQFQTAYGNENASSALTLPYRKPCAERQYHSADDGESASTPQSIPFRDRQTNVSHSQWREPYRDQISGHLTDSDEERSENRSESGADNLIKQFCPDHIVSCREETNPPLECCVTWRRFQKVWEEYNPFDPEDKTTQADLTFMVHCMWRWPFEMWDSDEEGGTKDA